MYRLVMADSVIRCLPGEDKTNGFFVACFVRGESLPETESEKLKSGKRQREEETEDHLGEQVLLHAREQVVPGGDTEAAKSLKESKEKTVAQLERARRKKQQQKKKRKIGSTEA
jgi:putative methyltransferase